MKKQLKQAKKQAFAQEYHLKPSSQINFEKLLEEEFDAFFTQMTQERNSLRPNTQAWFFVLGMTHANLVLLGRISKRLHSIT